MRNVWEKCLYWHYPVENRILLRKFPGYLRVPAREINKRKFALWWQETLVWAKPLLVGVKPGPRTPPSSRVPPSAARGPPQQARAPCIALSSSTLAVLVLAGADAWAGGDRRTLSLARARRHVAQHLGGLEEVSLLPPPLRPPRHDHLCAARRLGRVHRLRRGGCRPRRSEPRRLLARTSAQLLSCPFRTVCRRGHSSRRDLRGLKEDVISIWLTCAPIAGEALLGFHGSRKVVATCVIVGNDDLHRHRVGKSGSSRQRRELRTLSSELAHPRLEQLIRLKGTPTGSLNRSHSS